MKFTTLPAVSLERTDALIKLYAVGSFGGGRISLLCASSWPLAAGLSKGSKLIVLRTVLLWPTRRDLYRQWLVCIQYLLACSGVTRGRGWTAPGDTFQEVTPDLKLIVTALHRMQTRSYDENYVCPSVCLSVKCVHCDKTEEKCVQIFIPRQKAYSLVFWEEEWSVGTTLSTLNFGFN